MTRAWFSVIAVGALAAACAQPNPPVPSPAAPVSPPVYTGSPPADTGSPLESSASGVQPSPFVGSMPPSSMNANPSGTPSYVIHPGDPAGRQLPRPGGAPAF